MSFPPVNEQLAIIRRGIEKIVPEEELAAKLERSRQTNTPLRIKYGIDPTGVDLHLGHTVPMRKMRQFQELGHQAVIIIGNYTALVGDPSGRDETRARLTQEQVEKNAITYLEQIRKVIDVDKAEIRPNGDWFAEMNFARILTLCSKVTVAQLLTRDDFAKRYKAETPIYLHECLYPLMQAWDSVEIKADIELGGTEQLYSFMLARDLQKDANLPLQIGVMSPILVGTDGKKRMGKSLGNYIGISEPPYEMMKKFLQLSDDVLRMYFELLTNLPLPQVEEILAGHPQEAKFILAKTIIGEYHSDAAAEEAQQRWINEIRNKSALPADLAPKSLSRSALQDGKLLPIELLFQLGLCPSKSEARRLIQQGGAKLGEGQTVITSIEDPVDVSDGLIVWAGKKKYCRVQLTD